MKKSLRIVVLMHADFLPPESIEGMSDEQIEPFKTEFDVCATLRDMGHVVMPLGVTSDLAVIDRAIEDFRPDIAFNLLEEFDGVGVFDAHVVSYLEMKRLPYTGCNPRGLMLGHNKALSKMICRYHRIPVPRFHVFPIGKRAKQPARLEFPVIVKSLTEEGSIGISQASVVNSEEALIERVAFVHRTVGTDAIAEQFIDGREFYVGVLGNERLTTFPPFELMFQNLPDESHNIATGKVKWDMKYRKRIGVDTGPARDLPNGTGSKIAKLCKRAYRALSLSGYARIDLRLSESGALYLLEANPNPEVAYGEDFAESAETVGVDYDRLLRKILTLGFGYRLRGQA